MSDKRVSFIVDSVQSLCQLSEDEKQKISSNAIKSKEVQNFLDDPRLAYIICFWNNMPMTYACHDNI